MSVSKGGIVTKNTKKGMVIPMTKKKEDASKKSSANKEVHSNSLAEEKESSDIKKETKKLVKKVINKVPEEKSLPVVEDTKEKIKPSPVEVPINKANVEEKTLVPKPKEEIPEDQLPSGVINKPQFDTGLFKPNRCILIEVHEGAQKYDRIFNACTSTKQYALVVCARALELILVVVGGKNAQDGMSKIALPIEAVMDGSYKLTLLTE
jgi:hypothetical protein